MRFALVVPPARGGSGTFDHKFAESLSADVDWFSLMTYDYSGPGRPGPNAPIDWVGVLVLRLTRSHIPGTPGGLAHGTEARGTEGQDIAWVEFLRQWLRCCCSSFCFDSSRADYTGARGETVLGPKYIELLEKHHPTLIWEEDTQEHVFMYTEGRQAEHRVYFPTLQSIKQRLELASALGTGVRLAASLLSATYALMIRSIWELGQGLDFFYDLL
jgi:chitinase domain-containing protein 1